MSCGGAATTAATNCWDAWQGGGQQPGQTGGNEGGGEQEGGGYGDDG
ncbi:MAG: single-stranded DNA-binding protein, partial [Deltaproteobacteria bacterium]|nr:single-stranded DNA-binding protein [Nannocystaceae bacterium]